MARQLGARGAASRCGALGARADDDRGRGPASHPPCPGALAAGLARRQRRRTAAPPARVRAGAPRPMTPPPGNLLAAARDALAVVARGRHPAGLIGAPWSLAGE